MRIKLLFQKGSGAAAVTALLFTGNCMAQNQALPDTSQQTVQNTFAPQAVPITGKSFLLPPVLIATGALAVHTHLLISNEAVKEERDKHFIHFHTSIDNYLQFAPIVAGYGMLLNHPAHRFWPYTKKVLLTEAIMMALVYPTKQWVGEERPDKTANNSFPSGHTAQAFAGAVIFCDEFARHRFWLQASAYTSATAVGVFRVLNNRHWAGDVIAGAGFGILSAKLSEWIIEPHGRKLHHNTSL